MQRDEDSGSLGRELSEDEYDALNDETFTHAVRDDWEGEAVYEKKDPANWITRKLVIIVNILFRWTRIFSSKSAAKRPPKD